MSLDAETFVTEPGSRETSIPWRGQLPQQIRVGGALGRYVVLDLLGSGGMGAVYRAYDPQLDRIVAIKLVLEGSSESRQLRLQREAQAIAKLSHPNVVQVFDVGRVEHDGAVFIAMEYVAGMTLREWLDQSEPELEAILAVFLGAGEGLRAAHECGLIHRDFKPMNVLVDEEGRPRVVDFGLAKVADEQSIDHGSQHDIPASLSASSLPLDSKITREGAQVGTPAYMPPEQQAGLSVDARSDEFAFATALWEALFGELPFKGERAHAYAVAVLEGDRRELPRTTTVPRHIIAALNRALEPNAKNRYPDMSGLLAALRQDPRARRRTRRSWALGIGVGIAALVLASRPWAEPTTTIDMCVDAGQHVDSVWAPERQASVDRALRAIDRPFAAKTAERVDGELDELAHDWAALEVEQCRRSPDEPLYAVRRACLDDLHVRIDRLVSALDRPTAESLEHAVDAVTRLGAALGECRDLAALAARADRLVDEADPELARYAAMIVEADDALAIGDSSIAARLDAELPLPPRAGGWPTALVLDRARLGAEMDMVRGELEAAREQLLDAAQIAVGGPAAPLAAAEFHTSVASVSWEIGDLDAMELGHERAFALTEAARGPEHPATHIARGRTGHGPYARGDYTRALELYRAADAALATAVPDDDLDRLTLAGWIAEALDGMSRHREAISALADLHARHVLSYGESHPLTLDRLESLGRARLRAGDASGALADFEATLAGMRQDPSWQDVVHEAVLLGNIGAALTAAERWSEAEQRLEEAVERLSTGGEETSNHRTALEANLAVIRNSKGDYEGAREVLELCTARVDAQGSDGSHNGIMIRLQLVQTLLNLRELDEALRRAEEALVRAELAESKVLVAKAHLRRAQALDGLERFALADAALARGREALDGEAGVESSLAALADYEALRARSR